MIRKYVANLLLLWLLCPLLAVANVPPESQNKFQGQIDKWKTNFHSPGISLTLFDAKKNKFVNYSSGIAIKHNLTPVMADTLFNFSSIVKQFVAVTILQMQQEGKFQIDQTVGDIIKKYGASPGENFNPLWNKVSLRQLLNMTSGICSYWEDHRYQQFLASNIKTPPYKKQDDLITIARDCKVSFPPGSRWHYSDTNYLILARLIELASNRTFQEEMNHRFKNIKQLKSTYFSQYSNKSIINPNQLAAGYDSEENQIKTDVPLGDSSRFILSTTNDMAFWISEIFSSSLLSKQSLLEFKKLVSKETGQPLKSKTAIGYSFALDRSIVQDCGPLWFYPGNSPGCTTLVAWVPKARVSIAIALNADVNFDIFFDEIKRFIELNICRSQIDKEGDLL